MLHRLIQHEPTFDKHITFTHVRKEWDPCSFAERAKVTIMP